MRKTVRALRKKGFCQKMIKGARSEVKSQNGSLAQVIPLEIFNGAICFTAFESKDKNHMNKRKSAWQGAKSQSQSQKKKFIKEEDAAPTEASALVLTLD